MIAKASTLTKVAFSTRWLLDILLQEGVLDALPESEQNTNTNFNAEQAHTLNPIYSVATQQLRTTQSELFDESALLDEDAIVRFLAHHLGCASAQLHDLLPPAKCTLFPVEFLRTHAILPLAETEHGFEIAHSNPLDLAWYELMTHFCTMRVVPVLAAPSVLLRLLDSVYTMDDFISQARAERMQAHDQFVQPSPQAHSSVHEISERLLHISVRNQASDIHIEPQQDAPVRVRVRIDGILHTIQTLPIDVAHACINRIKILAHMDIAECRRAQDGRFQITIDDIVFDARVSVIPVLNGEKLVIRLLDKRVIEHTFATLGMQQDMEQHWRTLLASAAGVFVFSGPTGSGKSTSLYASLLDIGTLEKSIATIEDPIEYLVPHFSQTQVNETLGLTYAAGLKALLRQDPDIILLGEIRDAETAIIAMQAALTGHVVFTTIHAIDAFGAEDRLREFGLAESLIQHSVRAFVSQRLVRTLCGACQGIGCGKCHETGYHGRTALFQLRDMQSESAQQTDFFTLGMALVKQGITDEKEIKRVCYGI